MEKVGREREGFAVQEQPIMYLTLLEEVFPTAAPASEMTAIWAQLPESLVEKVLLFLPAVSQARFCTVCKPWRKLIMSSKFRDETALIALRSGKAMAVCSALEAFHTVERFKVAKMVLPADVDESGLKQRWNWCAQGGLLALISWCCSSDDMRIFVFNPVEETPCQELPPLPWKDPVGDLAMVVDGDYSFRVVLSYHAQQGRCEEGFYICSSSPNGKPPMTWSRVGIPQLSLDQVGLDISADLAWARLRFYSYALSRHFIYVFLRHRGFGTREPNALVRLSAKAEYISTVSPVPPRDFWKDVQFLPSRDMETLFAVQLGSLRLLDVEIVGHTRVDLIAYHTVSHLWTRVCQTYSYYSPKAICPKFIAPRRASVH